MPRWILSLRTLARECPAQITPCSSHNSLQWQASLRQWRSYSTALQEVQQDEKVSPSAIALAASSKYQKHSVAGQFDRAEDPATAEKTPISPQKSASGGVGPSTHSASRKRRRRLARAKKLRPNVHTLPEQSWWWARKKVHSTSPPKWVSTGSNAGRVLKFSSYWDRTFARITRHLDKDFPKWYLRPPSVPSLDIRTFAWVDEVLEQLDKGLDVFDHDLDSAKALERRHWVWKHVALWFLAYDPKSMMRFLRTTHTEPYVPDTWVADSLLHLARHFATFSDPERTQNMRELGDLFCHLADRKTKKGLSLHNPFLRTVMKHCPDETVFLMFQAFKDHKVETYARTYMHFATHFAKKGRFEDGLGALLEARNAGAALNGFAFRSNCATLLRKSIEQPDGLRVCLHLVSNLVEIGVHLNQPICDIIMLNAVEAGDLKTAFSVYHSLMERGLQPKESTFAVLLQGCKLNIDDADLLNETIRDAISNVAVRKSPLVATQILHCLALHHSKHHPDTALNTLTEAYAQLFDLRPLQKLNLPIPHIKEDESSTAEVMPPTRHAITFMLGASVQQLLANGARPTEILSLYNRWRDLVSANTPHIADLITTDHVSNLFLTAFIRTPKGLIHAARVVRDMQRPLPISEYIQCEPTVQTWSIFLHGFTRHGQTKLAEQVLTYMRSKGIEPNDVTWNTLITGYARAQDVEKTVEAVGRAEQIGMVWDAWTHGGLRKLREQQKLQDALRAERLEHNLDFGDELRSGIAERFSEAVEGEKESESEDIPPNEQTAVIDAGSVSYVPPGFGESAGDRAKRSSR